MLADIDSVRAFGLDVDLIDGGPMTQQQLERLLRQVAPVKSNEVQLPADRSVVVAAAQLLSRAEIDAAIDAVFPMGEFEVRIGNARQDANTFFKSVLEPKK